MRRWILAMAAWPALAVAQSGPVTALQPGETLLEVQAEGQATYLPDMATVTIGVVSTGTSAREATDANAAQMAAVVAAVRKAGVEDRYLRTQQITVEPRFARGDANDWQGQARISGYVARNSVAVTIRRLGIASDVIAAAFGAGANNVSGPALGASDPARGQADARTAAIAAARAEADTYAAALGMKVRRVLRVSERGNFARQVETVLVARAVAAPPPPAPSLEGGEMERRVTVWIDFALSPK